MGTLSVTTWSEAWVTTWTCETWCYLQVDVSKFLPWWCGEKNLPELVSESRRHKLIMYCAAPSYSVWQCTNLRRVLFSGNPWEIITTDWFSCINRLVFVLPLTYNSYPIYLSFPWRFVLPLLLAIKQNFCFCLFYGLRGQQTTTAHGSELDHDLFFV